jgi:hypothetical protein
MPRYITIPENANLSIGDTPYSFTQCVRHVVDTNPQFNENGPGIRAGVRILSQIQDANVGDVVVLEENDWKLLHETMEAPKTGLVPPLSITRADGVSEPINVPNRIFLHYLDAVSEEATNTKP